MSYALLEKACPRCKTSSIKTYWANIKALSRVAGQDGIPPGAGWLNDKLLARVRAMPLNRFKRFATAGVKAAQMYSKSKPKWSLAMSESCEGQGERQADQEGGAKLAEGRLQGSGQAGKGPAHGVGASGELKVLDEGRTVSLPAVPYCTLL